MSRSKNKPLPTIPECPAFLICKAQHINCEICLGLSVPEWQEHVKKVLARG